MKKNDLVKRIMSTTLVATMIFTNSLTTKADEENNTEEQSNQDVVEVIETPAEPVAIEEVEEVVIPVEETEAVIEETDYSNEESIDLNDEVNEWVEDTSWIDEISTEEFNEPTYVEETPIQDVFTDYVEEVETVEPTVITESDSLNDSFTVVDETQTQQAEESFVETVEEEITDEDFAAFEDFLNTVDLDETEEEQEIEVSEETEEVEELEETEELDEEYEIYYFAFEGGEVSNIQDSSNDIQGSTAIPNEGYEFVNWELDGVVISTQATLVPNASDITSEVIYVANFTPSKPAGSDSDITDTGIVVNASYGEGVVPNGARLVANNASISNDEALSIARQVNGNVSEAVALDIYFEKDGSKVETTGNVNITIGSLWTLEEGDTVSVAHVKHDSTVESIAVNNTTVSSVNFNAPSFSIYVIGKETGQVNGVTTYIFYGEDETELSRQMIKYGDILYEPDTSSYDDTLLFVGWATTPNASVADATVPFGAVTEVEDGETEVKYYAVYTKKLYVFFMDRGNTRVLQTVEGTKGDVIQTNDVTLTLSSEEAVSGWYTDAALTNKVTSVTLEDSNITLYPKVEKGHYLTFETGIGASYVAPQFVGLNSVTTEVDEPTRAGYSFKGWSTSSTPTTADFVFGKALTGDTTVYAVWEAVKTSYTVIYWKQSVNDDKNALNSAKTYDYAESRTITNVDSGSVVSGMNDREYKNFTFNSANTDSNITVEGDGSTVVNVYYDRNLLTINFHGYIIYTATESNSSYPQKYGLVNGEYVELWKSINGTWRYGNWLGTNYFGQRYIRTSDTITMTGLYGHTLAQNGYTWPSEFEWYEYNEHHLTFLDTFIFDNLSAVNNVLNVRIKNDTRRTYSLNHYKQNLDGSYSYDTPNNQTRSGGGTWYFTNKYDGFTVDSYYVGRNVNNNTNFTNTSAGSSVSYNNNLYVRYRRNSYDLAFYNYNGVAKTESVLHEMPLTEFASYVPERPNGLLNAYIFGGWYKDANLTVEFDFNTTMPAAGITLYAKWVLPEYTITAYDNMNGSGTPTTWKVAYRDKVDQSKLPTSLISPGSGYVFAGWATKNASGQFIIYNFNTEVTSDITLYPEFIDNSKFNITYDFNGGDGIAPIDSTNYASIASADVLQFTGVAPANKVFLSWNTERNGSGDSYYPGSKIVVSKNITLYAMYGDVETPTEILFDLNGGTGVPESSGILANNASYTLLKPTRDGYEFYGWLDETNNAKYNADDEIRADNLTTNKLVAQWLRIVTVKADDKTKVFGEADPTLTASESLQGLNLTYTLSRETGEDVATYVITPSGEEVQGEYYVVYETGVFTITPITDEVVVTITGHNDTQVYDGNEHVVTGYDVTMSHDLYTENDFTFNGTAEAKRTDVGTTNMNLAAEQFENTSQNFSNVKFVVTDGYIEITPLDVKLTVIAASNEKVYDGTALTDASYIVEGTLPEGFQLYATVEGTITNVGTVVNEVTSVTIIKKADTKEVTNGRILDANKIFDENGVTENFTGIEVVDGTLTITPATVTVTADNKSKTSGTSDPTLTATVTGLIGSDTVAYSFTRDSGEGAGTYAIHAKGKATQGNYNVVFVPGTLTITTAPTPSVDPVTPSTPSVTPVGPVSPETTTVTRTLTSPETSTVRRMVSPNTADEGSANNGLLFGGSVVLLLISILVLLEEKRNQNNA